MEDNRPLQFPHFREWHQSVAQGNWHNLTCCFSRARHLPAKDMQGKKNILLMFTNFMQLFCFYCFQSLEVHKDLDNKIES